MNNLTLFNGIVFLFLGFVTTSLIDTSHSTAPSTQTTTLSASSTEVSKIHKKQEQNENKKDVMIKKINEMYERYNLYRAKTSEIFKKKGWNSNEMIENDERIKNADATNHTAAKEFFSNYGLPTNSVVGEELAHRFWLIVLECDSDQDFQTRVLKQMYTAMETSDISTADYAYLTDRVRINRRATQIYGTQIRYNEARQTYEPYDLKNPETVDQRRVLMGLEPMETYIRKMNLKYNGSVKRNRSGRRLNMKY